MCLHVYELDDCNISRLKDGRNSMYYRIWINNNCIYREAPNETDLLLSLYEEYEHDSIDEVEEITADEYEG
jgi:hypothetical protein